MTAWVDTHCHLDAPEFVSDRLDVVQRAKNMGVTCGVIPAVAAKDFATAQQLAHQSGWVYALGIHPLYVSQAHADDLLTLKSSLTMAMNDDRCVAVGEIGLDGFVPGLNWELQVSFYEAQLHIAADLGLPVILHVRRSADALLKSLRRIRVSGGIAHAFNGSEQQASQFLNLGFKLGFGGSMTFERALHIRHLAATLPMDAIVLETDAPDIPPHWLYRTASERAQGLNSRNEPAELPRIAQTLADLRGISLQDVAQHTMRNAMTALPRLAPHLEAVVS